MESYEYIAYDNQGKKIKGKNKFNNKDEVVEFLTEKDLYIVEIKEFNKINQYTRKLKDKELYLICNQLSILLRAGCEITNSLNIVQNQSNKHIKVLIQSINDRLHEGKSLSESFKSQNTFSNFFVNMIISGEISGKLDYIMHKLANYYNKEKELKQKVQASLIYPIILSIASIVVIMFLLVYIIPSFESVFMYNEIELPLITKVMLDISKILKEYYIAILGVLIVLIIMFLNSICGNNKFKYKMDKLKFRIPYIKNVFTIVMSSKFIRSLYILISSGVQIIEAIDISSKVIDNKYISNKLDISKDYIKKGNSLYDSLREANIFPKMLLSMIKVGEEGGMLDESLLNASNYYEKEVENTLNKIVKLIEPIIILIMGIVIGIIVISIMIPMFDMMTII